MGTNVDSRPSNGASAHTDRLLHRTPLHLAPPARWSGAPCANSRSARVARQIVAELFGTPHERRFAVRYWTGEEERPGAFRTLPLTLVFQRGAALRRMLLPPTEARLAAAFLRDDFDIEGDVEAAAALAGPLAKRLRSPRRLLRLARLLTQLPRHDHVRDETCADRPAPAARASQLWRRFTSGLRHAPARDARAIKHHYDVGNDFYALWLDEHLAYSCAYFPAGDEDLREAQEAKFDLICRKLRLRPGETLLDIGCGWGGLARYAASRYGVEVLGITLSEAQAAFACDRIARDGLQHRCRVEVRDYRDLPSASMFDKVASVGMFEHVGRSRLEAYFTAAWRHTRPRGLFLNHGIISLDDARSPRGEAAPRAASGGRDGSWTDTSFRMVSWLRSPLRSARPKRSDSRLAAWKACASTTHRRCGTGCGDSRRAHMKRATSSATGRAGSGHYDLPLPGERRPHAALTSASASADILMPQPIDRRTRTGGSPQRRTQ